MKRLFFALVAFIVSLMLLFLVNRESPSSTLFDQNVEALSSGENEVHADCYSQKDSECPVVVVTYSQETFVLILKDQSKSPHYQSA